MELGMAFDARVARVTLEIPHFSPLALLRGQAVGCSEPVWKPCAAGMAYASCTSCKFSKVR